MLIKTEDKRFAALSVLPAPARRVAGKTEISLLCISPVHVIQMNIRKNYTCSGAGVKKNGDSVNLFYRMWDLSHFALRNSARKIGES